MNMKLFQSVHGKQKIKLINFILMHNCTKITLIAIILNTVNKLLLINNHLFMNLTKKIYYIQQIIEQLSFSNCKNLIQL